MGDDRLHPGIDRSAFAPFFLAREKHVGRVYSCRKKKKWQSARQRNVFYRHIECFAELASSGVEHGPDLLRTVGSTSICCRVLSGVEVTVSKDMVTKSHHMSIALYMC